MVPNLLLRYEENILYTKDEGKSWSAVGEKQKEITITCKAVAKIEKQFTTCVAQHTQGHISYTYTISVPEIIHKFKI